MGCCDGLTYSRHMWHEAKAYVVLGRRSAQRRVDDLVYSRTLSIYTHNIYSLVA